MYNLILYSCTKYSYQFSYNTRGQIWKIRDQDSHYLQLRASQSRLQMNTAHTASAPISQTAMANAGSQMLTNSEIWNRSVNGNEQTDMGHSQTFGQSNKQQ